LEEIDRPLNNIKTQKKIKNFPLTKIGIDEGISSKLIIWEFHRAKKDK
jgi:hypothetical protein